MTAARLAGRAALVTGAAGGIGRATCVALAREGAAVVAVDLDAEGAAAVAALVEAAGGRAWGLGCDVSDEGAVETTFTRAAELVDVDTLVSNAAVSAGRDALHTTSEEWDATLGVNLRGTWLCARALLRRRLDPDRGATIVSTSSTNAFYAEPHAASYSASKGAISALTRSLAIDFASRGVRANCVAPGIIDAGLTAPVLADSSDAEGLRRHWASLHAAGRLGRADEVAATIVFLSSDDASFFSGAEVVVDGGLSIGTRTSPE